MIIETIRTVRGYVSFTVSGRYPERFINITASNDIHIWNVLRTGEGFSACMYMTDYRCIRPLAKKAGVRLRIRQKHGLPSFISKYRGRVGVVIGACAFILTVFIMSLFIWSIDISGLDTVSLSEMKEILRDEGLFVGSFKPSLDYQGISREIMLKKREIGWMAVNVSGSYASVEVKEESKAPEVSDIYSPCNVKAEHDGRILSIDAYQGERVITEGSGVIEGQLIVSGVMSDERGGLRLVHADARVMAQTERKAVFSTDENFTALKPNGDTAVRRRLNILGLSLPYVFEAVSSPYSSTDIYTESPSPLGVSLPIERESEFVSALKLKECQLNDNSAKELLIAQSEIYETFTLSDCTVKNREYSLTHSNGVYTLSVTYTCVEDIARSVPIGTDENTDLEPHYEEPTKAH